MASTSELGWSLVERRARGEVGGEREGGEGQVETIKGGRRSASRDKG